MDEYSWETEDGVQDEVKRLGEKAIEEAGKALKLALPLEGEGKLSYEGSWLHVH